MWASLSGNVMLRGGLPFMVADDDRAIGRGRRGFSSSISESESYDEFKYASDSRFLSPDIVSDRTLTSGLLLTDMPESELKVS